MGIFDIFSNKDAQQAANIQTEALGNANTAGQADLTQGLDLATNSYTAGIKPFLTNLATDQAGQGAYADATGANGAAGNARAVANFQSSPGYQYALDQALDAVKRNQASTGQLASGGTNVDLLKSGEGVANQNWQQYVTNLLPFLGQSTANAGGVLTGESGLAGVQNANRTNAANMVYGTDTAQGNAQANATLANYNASANAINAAQNIAKSVASFLPF